MIPSHPFVTLALCTLGALYGWACGTPKDARKRWPSGPYDCSGHAQAILVMAGTLPADAPDRNALGLANACDPVALADLQPLDLIFYGVNGITHVAVYIGGGMVVTMSGGGPSTHGDDPNACAQARPIDYRKDRVVCGRIKPALRGRTAFS